MLKTILNFHDMLDRVPTMIKNKQDNNEIDCISLVYAKIKTELLWPIWPGMVYDVNQTGQQCDWSYKCSLHKKNEIERLWPIDQVWYVTKIW